MSSDYELAMRLHREEKARAARNRTKRKRYNPTTEAAKPQLGRKQKKAQTSAKPKASAKQAETKPKARSKAVQAKRRRTVTTPSYVMQPFHIQDGKKKKERTVWYAGTVTKVKGKQAELIVVRWMDGDVTGVDQWAAKLRNRYLVSLTRKQWADMSASYEVNGTFKPVTKREMAHWMVK